VALASFFGGFGNAAKLAKIWPAGTGAQNAVSLSAIVTDYLFYCPMLKALDGHLAAHGSKKRAAHGLKQQQQRTVRVGEDDAKHRIDYAASHKSPVLDADSAVSAFMYRFNHSWSFNGWGPRYPFCEGHVCHGSELPFVFE
jgi:hypothetical protein